MTARDLFIVEHGLSAGGKQFGFKKFVFGAESVSGGNKIHGNCILLKK